MTGTPVATRASARKRGRNVNRPEQELQIATTEYLVSALPKDCFFTFINNGMGRSKAEGGIAKAMGLRAGTPDYLFVYRGRAYFIEMKAGKNTETDNQILCHADLAEAGAPVATCWSIKAVEMTLRSWGIPLHAHVMGET